MGQGLNKPAYVYMMYVYPPNHDPEKDTLPEEQLLDFKKRMQKLSAK